jgi:[ribosomal protein S18]-alanine N-acetyltransferase
MSAQHSAAYEADDVQLRPMQLSDLAAVLAIEQQAYAFPWTHGNFVDSLNSGYAAQCAEQASGVIGYTLCMPVVDEVHLLNITISPAFQGRGLGRWLLAQVQEQARRARAASLWLEVRPSNGIAIALYESAGFVVVGQRPNYYPAPGGMREDALLMKQFLQGAA